MYQQPRPLENRARVYLGVIAITGASFPPILVVTIPAFIAWYQGEKRIEREKQLIQIQKQDVIRERELMTAVRSFR